MEDSDDHPMHLVEEFMLTFGQAVPGLPKMPLPEVKNFRLHLIDEEADELADSDNLVDYLDAIGDLLYVVYGAALAAGFTERQVDSAFREIHRSNMSKLWSEDELSQLPSDAKAVLSVPGKWIVRRNDGKIIKSPSYSPANLKPIIE